MRGDLISDLLTRIRNASNVSRSIFIVPRTKASISILHLLFLEGFISGYFVRNHRFVEIQLAYDIGLAVLSQVERISKPSNRIYWSICLLEHIMKAEPQSFYIVSTNCGLISGNSASTYHVGGEVICKVI